MDKLLKESWHNESGQDLTEHALLLAMIALMASALFFDSGASVSGVWNAADLTIATAYHCASS